MKLARRFWWEECGQGLVDYTLGAVLVALVFWFAIKDTNIGMLLGNEWFNMTLLREIVALL